MRSEPLACEIIAADGQGCAAKVGLRKDSACEVMMQDGSSSDQDKIRTTPHAFKDIVRLGQFSGYAEARAATVEIGKPVHDRPSLESGILWDFESVPTGPGNSQPVRRCRSRWKRPPATRNNAAQVLLRWPRNRWPRGRRI